MVSALVDVGVGTASDVVVDLGSGGGVPGWDVVVGLPKVSVVLTERRQRRVDTLVLGVSDLGVADRVSVWGGDVYDLAWSEARGSASAVIARSFGPPAVVVEYGAPLLRTGGWLIVSDVDESDERWPDGPMSDLGWSSRRRWSGGWSLCGWQRVAVGRDDLPRRGSAPRRRPLF